MIFLPAARVELIAAQDWYEKESPGLGARCRAEIGVQIDRIATNPLQFPVLLKDVRRARLRRFPYGLFFRGLPEAAFVIACFHSRRDPMVWRARV